MYIQNTPRPASAIHVAQDTSPSASDVSFTSLSQQRPMHPMRLSQYELGALLHALPTEMLAAFAAAYQLPTEAAPLVCKRLQAAPWTQAQTGQIQFFVKWCLTTTSDFHIYRGQRALQHYLAACIETAFRAPCRRKAPFANEVLDVGSRLGELRQRDIVSLVRAICAAQLTSADASAQPALQMPQAPAPSDSAQLVSALPKLPDAFAQPFVVPSVVSARTHACLSKLQDALKAPGGLSALAGHVNAHAALKESVSELKDDFRAWFHTQDAAVLERQTTLRAQDQAIAQLEQSLKEASEDLAYDMWRCDGVLQTLEQTRAVLRES